MLHIGYNIFFLSHTVRIYPPLKPAEIQIGMIMFYFNSTMSNMQYKYFYDLVEIILCKINIFWVTVLQRAAKTGLISLTDNLI